MAGPSAPASPENPREPARGDTPPLPSEAAVTELARAYTLAMPSATRAGVVIDVPHAGRCYPPAFVASSRLSPHALRRSEDAFVDALFMDAVSLGAPLLRAEFPRAYLDVNREPYELDPRMFEGRLPGFANTRSLRVAGGLGTVPRVVGDGHEIYPGRIPVTEALARIENWYKPYHAALRDLIGMTRRDFGACLLIDAHSMPSSSMDRDGVARADVVLGDRYGTSAAPWVMDLVEAGLTGAGLRVTRNRPYAGGYITEAYGDPRNHVHVVQIEVNRSLYMDERSIRPNAGFSPLRRVLRTAMTDIFPAFDDAVGGMRFAAE